MAAQNRSARRIAAASGDTLEEAAGRKINFSAVMHDLDARPMQREVGEGEARLQTPWTIGQASATALISPDSALAQSPDEHLRRFDLALKINGAGKIMLVDADIRLIKARVTVYFAPIVAAQVIRALED